MWDAKQLETQLNNVRLTHSLMSQYLELDPFEDILNEMNDSTSLVSFHGRIVLHVRRFYIIQSIECCLDELSTRLTF